MTSPWIIVNQIATKIQLWWRLKLLKKNIKAIRLQRWWRYRRIIHDRIDRNYKEIPLTKNTLIRYYIKHYKYDWLTDFPRIAIEKLNLEVYDPKYLYPTNEHKKATIRTFKEFCNEYMTIELFSEYGW
jgi:hypothetical protein